MRPASGKKKKWLYFIKNIILVFYINVILNKIYFNHLKLNTIKNSVIAKIFTFILNSQTTKAESTDIIGHSI
jgi:hypothetical protein